MRRSSPSMIRLAGLWFTLMSLMAACSLPTGSSPENVGGGAVVIEGAPVVRISSPLPNSTFLQGTTVNIMARIENAGPDVASVAVSLNGNVVGEVQQPNASGAPAFTITQSWPATAAGDYVIGVITTRATGEASEEATVNVTIVDQAQGGGGSGDTTSAETMTEDDMDTTSGTESEDTESDTGTTTGETVAPAGDRPSIGSGLRGLLSRGLSGAGSAQTAEQPAEEESAVDEQPIPEEVVEVPAEATQPPPPTEPPPPTAVPASPTSSVPMARMVSGVNVRSGPSTIFDPPIGSLAANDSTEILAVNPAGDWYKIRYYNGEGWVYGPNVEVSGNASRLPQDAGPPTPAPTAPPTATPVPSQVNIEVVNIQTAPHPLTCNETSEIQVTVRNSGTTATSSGGVIRVEAVLLSSGAVLESTETIFQQLQPGQQITTSAFITVSINTNEAQRIRVLADANNQIAESNESDNGRDDVQYILQKGGCP